MERNAPPARLEAQRRTGQGAATRNTAVLGDRGGRFVCAEGDRWPAIPLRDAVQKRKTTAEGGMTPGSSSCSGCSLRWEFADPVGHRGRRCERVWLRWPHRKWPSARTFCDSVSGASGRFTFGSWSDPTWARRGRAHGFCLQVTGWRPLRENEIAAEARCAVLENFALHLERPSVVSESKRALFGLAHRARSGQSLTHHL